MIRKIMLTLTTHAVFKRCCLVQHVLGFTHRQNVLIDKMCSWRGFQPSYAWTIFATLLHEMGFREPTKANDQLTRQNEFSFTKIKLMYCLTRKALKCNYCSEHLCVSSNRVITLQKQLSVGSPGTQVLHFWSPFLVEKCQKAQIPCISPFSS